MARDVTNIKTKSDTQGAGGGGGGGDTERPRVTRIVRGGGGASDIRHRKTE